MITLKKGTTLDFRDSKKGRRQDNSMWMLAYAKSDNPKSKDQFIVFIDNAEEAQYWNKGVVDEIVSVQKKARKTPDGQWEQIFSFTVKCKGEDTNAPVKATAAEKFNEFMDLSGDDDDSLPFN